MNTRFCNALTLAAAAALLLAGCQTTGSSQWPETTDDGLERVETKRVDVAYWKEGATLADYDQVNIAPVSVEFRKNWQRDQNSSRRSVSERITQEDMDRMRAWLAEEFRAIFTDELGKGGYAVTGESGPDVLSLRPAIVNLDVAAPDLSMRQAGRTTTYTTRAGEMTLVMELYDSHTNSLIGRVVDRRQDMDTGFPMMTTSVSNRATADRWLRAWAKALREALDEAKAR